MQGVILTPTFLSDAKNAGLSDDEVMAIASALAGDPLQGDLMEGTGGARKVRFPRPGRGKSGGVRTVHYFGGEDVPVFLLAVFAKGDKANLSKAERNELAAILSSIADDYRASQRKPPRRR